MSARLVLIVRTCRPLIVNSLPCAAGLLGLIVATSNTALASAAIGFGGSGIFHAVSVFARDNDIGSGLLPWVNVPLIEFPSAATLPSKVTAMPANAILKVQPWSETEG